MQHLRRLSARQSDPTVSRACEPDPRMHDLVRPLTPPPQTRAEDTELADHGPGHDGAVAAQDGVARIRRRRDELHQDVTWVRGGGDRVQEGRDRAAVDVVAAAFALGFEHVSRGGGRVGGEFEAFGIGGQVVLRGEGGAEGGEGGGRAVREEALEGVGRREGLLDLFRAREVGEDRGAFDRITALEVVARCPRGGRAVFGRRVESAEVDDCCFVWG